MPMDRSKYPHNWDQIATDKKNKSGWCCDKCGTLHMGDGSMRTCLTVHHLDHDPSNNHPDNLVSLCAPCHLREEAKWKRSAKGKQRRLFKGE